MDDRRLGILGGGRVARLLTLAAHRLGLNVSAIDELGTDSPVGQITNSSIEGKIEDPQNIQTLASQCEVLTSVIGCVDTSLLKSLEEQGLSVHPSSALTEVLQSLIKQRETFSEATIPCVQSASVSSIDDASEAVTKLGLPLLLRSDNHQGDSIFIESLDDLKKAIQTNPKKVWLCERYVEVTRSLVVIVARNIHGQCVAYPVSEMVRNSDGTESATLTPARVDHKLTSHVISYAKKSITTLQAVGCFGVEVSVTRDDDIFVDRLACRVHEAGNFTIEACGVDQYEQHLRCILGLSLQGTQLTSAYALCINVLGTGDDIETKAIGMQSLSLNGARVHWYGKQEQQGSHMGHITIVADNLFRLRKECTSLKSACADQLLADVTARVGIIMGSDSDLPCMRACADVLEELSIEFELTIVSAHRTPHRLVEYAENAEKRGIQVIIAGAGGAAHLPGMVASLTTLPVIGVPVKTSTLHGVDSLYSIVQMPRGIPVATVAIGNAKNAGLLAARILGSSDIVVRRRLAEYSRVQEKVVEQKASKLEQIGYKAYLNESST